jgi:hypothetical protein
MPASAGFGAVNSDLMRGLHCGPGEPVCQSVVEGAAT